MYFRQILDELNGCASYVIASLGAGEAAIIDPSADQERYDALLTARGLRLRFVIDSHVHADHISLARALADAHDAQLCLHAVAAVTYPHHTLNDGDELALGEARLRVWHTPGHRPELISLLVSDLARSPEPALALTGDSLLVGDVGRPDFGGGDAAQQYESIMRLLGLPDWVAIFPGHVEGPCGKSLSGQASTTVGYERLYNPMSGLTREAFVAALTRDVPARPLNMTAIEATNRGRAAADWAMLTRALAVPQAEIEALADRAPQAMVVDVREPAEYEVGHVPGAISLPQAELASRMEELPRDVPLYLICRSGARSLRATQFLHLRGLERAVNVRGGTQAWRAQGRPLAFGAQPGEAPAAGSAVPTSARKRKSPRPVQSAGEPA